MSELLHIANLEREIECLRGITASMIESDIAFCDSLGNKYFAARFRKLREDLDAIIPPSRISILECARKLNNDTRC